MNKLCLKMFPLLTSSILTFILIGTVTCQPTFLYNICISNDTSGGNYQTNLANILGSLSSTASQNSFSTTTSNGIYTLYLCRGDVNTSTCQTCVSKAAQEITQKCPSSNRAIIWYDECMLRYTNRDFFGEVQTDPAFMMYNVMNTTSPQDTDVQALALVYNLISSVQSSPMLFKTGSSDGLPKRYAMVQCTRDINGTQCYSCLAQLSNNIDNCCQGKVGWRIISPSCYLRYEEYLFYQESPSSPPPQSPPPKEEGNGEKSTTKIVAITVPTVAAVAALLGFLCYWCSCRKRRQQDRERSQEIPLQQYMEGMSMERRMQLYSEDDEEMQYFNLSTIVAATDGFSDANKLGEGGFGPVYKGKLLDGKEIAVKRLSMRSSQGMEEFKNEVVTIVKLQHRNLVKLFGCCIEGEEKILVYEYLPNGSLDAFLFDPTKSRQLEWTRRTQIVNGIARGLLYLHEDSRLKIIHRDLKASNVLLDDEMQPKISDFGTARIFGGNQIEANTARVVGTYGYMAPEYAMEGLFSVKSDVYSFGILVLEIISGKKNSGFYCPNRPQSLLSYAWQLWKENKGMELVDANLVKSCPVNEALRWIHIALLCVQEDLNLRPMMSSVVLMLRSNSNLPQPKPPPSLIGRLLGSDQSTSTGVGTGFLSSDVSTTTGSC